MKQRRKTGTSDTVIQFYDIRGLHTSTWQRCCARITHHQPILYLQDILILARSTTRMFETGFYFPYFHYAFKLDNFEHATMFIHLALFAGFSLSTELIDSLELFSRFVGIFRSSVFIQELL
ncbi:uncharacterized protein [Cicer arietinum]|uniref:uncharacterized protein n=1 Tax=Cicer arietinum TaxID=3827 RepID=UPI003CC68424